MKSRRTLFHWREADVRRFTDKRVFMICRPSGKVLCRANTIGSAEEICAAMNARLKAKRRAA